MNEVIELVKNRVFDHKLIPCNVSEDSCEFKCYEGEPHDDAFVFARIEKRENSYNIYFIPDQDDIGLVGKKTLLRINLPAGEVVDYLQKMTKWLYEFHPEDKERWEFIKKTNLLDD